VSATLSELTASARRLALVGLAKNTGKTVALAALLRELHDAGRVVGVTSVGRDGEEHDVIDFRIEKPAVALGAGGLVATTDGLLRASGIPHELLERTGMRTPLGEVLIARLKGAGTIEVAGPSAAADVARVSDAMLSHGAEQVLIDGAIDRRAASSPEVADGLVMSTGAILSEEIDEVVRRTADAVAVVRLPSLEQSGSEGALVRERAAALEPGESAMLDDDEQLTPHPLPPRFALTAEAPAIADLLGGGSSPRWLVISGAVPEAFLDGLIQLARRRTEPVKVLAADPTRVFLSRHAPSHYLTGGVELHVREPIDLRALTVNPVAPQSHSFDSARLRGLLSERIAEVPIFDVLHPSYPTHPPAKPPSEPGARRPARAASIAEETA
jgi:hypothetical protein